MSRAPEISPAMEDVEYQCENFILPRRWFGDGFRLGTVFVADVVYRFCLDVNGSAIPSALQSGERSPFILSERRFSGNEFRCPGTLFKCQVEDFLPPIAFECAFFALTTAKEMSTMLADGQSMNERPFNRIYSGKEIFMLPLKSKIASITLIAGLLVTATTAPAFARSPQRQSDAKLQKEVRHVLVMQPFYSVFDNLEYRVDGDHVTLVGQVVRPTLKSDAENSVKSIEGVSAVDNQIEVLPTSPGDDRIRRAEIRAIFPPSNLQRYAQQASRQSTS